MQELPLIVYALLPVIVLLMIVCRIGIYKYTTANRIYGYELHLERTKHFENESVSGQGWNKKMREIGWEEALRAWRIAQVSLFRSLYRTPQNSAFGRFCEKTIFFSWINYLRPDFYQPTSEASNMIKQYRVSIQNISEGYPWYMPKLLTESISGPKSSYYAGTYLKGTISLLTLMQILMLIPLVLMTFQLVPEAGSFDYYIGKVVLTLMLVIILLRAWRTNLRRKILEDELSSIHSCSLIWQMVVQVHYSSISRGTIPFQGYTRDIAANTAELCEQPFNMYTNLKTIKHDFD